MIPDFQTIMLPLLRQASDEHEHSLREAIDALADHFRLTDIERRELLPSGQQAVFDNRVGWARTYLRKAGLLEATRRGHFRLTARGTEVLDQNPSKITVKFLDQFPEFREFRLGGRAKGQSTELEGEETPKEQLENAYQSLRNTLEADLLQLVKSSPPSLFESVVVDLLIKLGYGGSRRDAGRTIGRSGDEGIDGYIDEDRLGLDKVYVQAKRWDATVSRPEVQKFAGALQGKRARKGVFITTSDFSREARQFAESIDTRLILIDGERLAQLMVDYNVGVEPAQTYEVKQIDSDYFAGA